MARHLVKFSPPKHAVTNQAFLDVLFTSRVDRAAGHICHFPGDPDTNDASWTGYAYWPGEPGNAEMLRGTPRQNSFTTFSSFKLISGHYAGRLKSAWSALHAYMLDDIGTGLGAKISPDRLRGTPSWIIETSPGNWQVGYLLKVPEQRAEIATGLLSALVHAGLGAEKDPGMKGLTRYGRMPQGINGKAKYRLEDGEPPEHRLLHWRPDLSYTSEEIAEMYSIPWEIVEQSGERASANRKLPAAAKYDSWAKLLSRAVGRMSRFRDKGDGTLWVDIECPWVDEHTGRVDNGSAYMAGGGFQCHHGHCHERTWHDVRMWLENHHEDPEIRKEARELAAAEAFTLVLYGVDLEPAPPLEEDEEEVDLLARARALTPVEGEHAEATAVIRDAVASGLGPSGMEVVLDRVAHHAGLKLQTVREMAREARGAGEKEEQRRFKEARAAREVEAPDAIPVMFDEDWRDKDFNGTPTMTSRNVERVLLKMGGPPRRNLMTGQLEFQGRLGKLSADGAIEQVADACEQGGLKVGTRLLGKIRLIAEREAYHPFEEFLRGLEWDGEDRLEALYATLPLGSSGAPMRKLILDKWLAAVVAAGRHLYRNRPGFQPRGVLILTGEQYGGKTTWLGRLFDGLFPGSYECFQEGIHFDGSVDSRMAACSTLVSELGEIDSTLNRTEMGKLKAFLSGAKDTYRKPYGYEPGTEQRRTVFCGTVNHAEFLRDETGNTRFWPLSVKQPDLDMQRQFDMKQVWAQVQHMTQEKLAECGVARQAGRYVPLPWHMSREEMRTIEAANETFREIPPAEQLLLEMFCWEAPVWRDARTLHDRLAINPLMTREIMDLAAGHRHQMKMWTAALRRLTQCRRGVMGVPGGRSPGRYWPMPPLRTRYGNDDAPDLEDAQGVH